MCWGTSALKPGRVGVPVGMGVQVADPRALPQAAEQLPGAVPRHRRAAGRPRQGDERVIAVQHAVLELHVIGVEVEHDVPDRHGPLLHPLDPCLVGVVVAGNHAHFGAAHAQVLVPQPQRLADPQPRLVQQAHQEPVPGPRARRHRQGSLLRRQGLRDLAPRGDPQRAEGIPRRPPDMREHRDVRAGRPGADQLTEHEHARRPGRRRAPEPVEKMRNLLQGYRPPVQPGLPGPGEEVPQVVRVRLDRVR